MSLKDAETLYYMVYYGVPVEDTGVPMPQSDYVWDWSVRLLNRAVYKARAE